MALTRKEHILVAVMFLPLGIAVNGVLLWGFREQINLRDPLFWAYFVVVQFALYKIGRSPRLLGSFHGRNRRAIVLAMSSLALFGSLGMILSGAAFFWLAWRQRMARHYLLLAAGAVTGGLVMVSAF